MSRGLLQDLRYTLRFLVSSPRFTATAVLTLALGIGAMTAGFSLANWLILRPLPGVRDDGRLVVVWFGKSGQGGSFMPNWLTYPNRADLLSMAPAFEALAGYQPGVVNLALERGAARRANVEYVTPDYFSVLGLRPLLGRFFAPEEDQAPQGSQVAVISERLWREVFNGDPAALGRPIRVNGVDFTVVGVSPPDFQGSNRFERAQLWLPGTTQPLVLHRTWSFDRGGGGFYEHFGRLAPGATYEQAREQLRIATRRLAELYPAENEIMRDWDPAIGRGTGAAPLWRGLTVRKATLLFGLTALLLIVTIANVAGLLLFRGLRRRAELAVRKALGATDGRVMGLCVAESVLLALVGGALGLLVAVWLLDLFQGSTILMARIADVPLDWRVLGFAIVGSLGAGILMGLVPGWLATRTEVVNWLKEAARTKTGGEALVRQALTTVQLGISLVLIVLALLFVRTLQRLNAVELGFDPNDVTVFHLDPGDQGYQGDQLRNYLAELQRRVQELPGVESASLSSGVPFSGGFSFSRMRRAEDEPAGALEVNFEQVSTALFETLHLPVRQGRIFTHADSADGVVVSTALARRLFGDADPIGRSVSCPDWGGQGRRCRVVGVVGDSRWRELDAGIPLFAYRPYSPERTRVLAVRSPRPRGDLVAAVSSIAASLDSSMPLHDVATLRDLLAREESERRVLAKLLTLLSGLAVTLAAVGLYGLVAYGVETRSREFGIRIALGAERRSIAQLAMRQGARLALIGVVLGGAGGAIAARMVRSQLFGVTPLDVATFGLAAALLLGAALLASYVPARRAARMDPMEALRYE